MKRLNRCWIRTELKRLVKNQFGRCFYCKDPIFVYKDSPAHQVELATYDHIKPRRRRGKSKSPGVAACLVCNCMRGHQDFITFWLRSKRPDFLPKVRKQKQKLLTKALKELG